MTPNNHFSTLPIVDFSSDHVSVSVADQIGEALHSFGFVYLTNHGVPADAIQDAFAVARTFFQLPAVTKCRYRKTLTDNKGKLTGIGYNGYSPPDSELVDLASARRELKETYEIMQRPVRRVYPGSELVPGFKEVTDRLGAAFRALAVRFNTALGLALGLADPDFFNRYGHGLRDPASVEALNQLRLAYYPGMSAAEVATASGSGAMTMTRCAQHVDASLFTMLVQDCNGGLEVADGDGWTLLPHLEGAIMIQGGDQLDLWSGGYFPACLHRVGIRNTPGPELVDIPPRQSITFFVTPDDSTQLRALRTKFSEGEGKLGGGGKYAGQEWNAYEHYIGRLTDAYREGALGGKLK